MTASQPPRLPRLPAVDALRGCAALLVVLHHTGGLAGPLAVLKPLGAMGWSGVGLFLVLSGFSIHFRWAASEVPHHEFAVGRFARRRFFRLYPTYAAAVVATIAVALLLGQSLDAGTAFLFAKGDTPAALGIASQALLVGANLVHVPYVGVAWSLGLEAQLYAMYALLVRRLRRIGVLRVVIWAFAISLAWRLGSQLATSSMPIGQFFPDGHSTELSRLFYAQLPARAFEWLLGVLAAEMYFGRARLPGWARSTWVGVALLAIAALLFRHPVVQQSLNGHDFMLTDVLLDQLLGVAFFIVLLATIHREQAIVANTVGRLTIGALAWVGTFSYSLYLLHVATLELSGTVLGNAGIAGASRTLGQWSFTLLAARLFYLAIERRFADGSVDRWAAARWTARGRPRVPA